MFQAWLKKFNPLLLLVSLFPFALGAGMADYFGHTPSPWRYLAGQMLVLLLLVAGELLYLYISLIKAGKPPFSFNGNDQPPKQPSPFSLFLVISVLLVCSLLAGVYLEGQVPDGGLLFLFLVIMVFLAVVVNGSPSLRFSGYGEIAQALMLGTVIPAFSFVIQNGELHPFILPATLPFVLIWLAVCLIFQLASFGEDSQKQNHTLLLRLTWQRAVLFHHILLLSAYIFIGLTPIFGLAWRLVWPMLIALPAAVFEIWLVNRIALGWPPRWLLLKTVASLNFILPVYLLTSRFWLV